MGLLATSQPRFANEHRFTVDEFERMAQSNVLDPQRRFELLDGTIVEMTPEGPEHATVTDLLHERFAVAARARYLVRGRNPLRLARTTQPEPDIAVVARRPSAYRREYATASDTFLAIEVAFTSLKTDREVKAPLCAEAGVPEYWIVNLRDGVIEVHRRTTEGGGGYGPPQIVRRGERIAPLAFPDVAIDVGDLLDGLDS